jgi:hypothetical protein
LTKEFFDGYLTMSMMYDMLILAGLDAGETVTLPSVEDPNLWAAFDNARLTLAQATQTETPASRYGLSK